MSYYFYLANGLTISQELPLDFQALYHSGGGVCALLDTYFGGVRWGGRIPLGGHSHLLFYTHHSYLTQPAPATRKSGLDA